MDQAVIPVENPMSVDSQNRSLKIAVSAALGASAATHWCSQAKGSRSTGSEFAGAFLKVKSRGKQLQTFS